MTSPQNRLRRGSDTLGNAIPRLGTMGSLAPKTDYEKYCNECGAVIRKAAEICPKCGVRQMAPGFGGTGRSRVAAALFAILLGGLGIHKFYLGRIGQGIIYLLLFWTFIPALIALIEGIVYLTMSDEEFARKYS